MSWEDDKPTKKQIDFIKEAFEFSEAPLEAFDFKNATKGSASDWISRNGYSATHKLVSDYECRGGEYV